MSELELLSPLSPAEESKWLKAVSCLDNWWSARHEAAEWLRVIRDEKLYRSRYKTFEDFAQEYFGIGRAQAYRILEFGEIANEMASNSVSPMGDISGEPQKPESEDAPDWLPKDADQDPKPAPKINERQARELAKAPPGTRKAVFEKVAAQGPVTAKAIAKAVTEAKQPRPLDCIGREVPDDALPYWNRQPEVEEKMRVISQMKSFVKKQIENDDPIYGLAVKQELEMALTRVYYQLKSCRPYAVCYVCQGHPGKPGQTQCTVCHTMGIINERQWDNAPQEIRDMIMKGVKK